jgi:hypothetical protein
MMSQSLQPGPERPTMAYGKGKFVVPRGSSVLKYQIVNLANSQTEGEKPRLLSANDSDIFTSTKLDTLVESSTLVERC